MANSGIQWWDFRERLGKKKPEDGIKARNIVFDTLSTMLFPDHTAAPQTMSLEQVTQSHRKLMLIRGVLYGVKGGLLSEPEWQMLPETIFFLERIQCNQDYIRCFNNQLPPPR